MLGMQLYVTKTAKRLIPLAKTILDKSNIKGLKFNGSNFVWMNRMDIRMFDMLEMDNAMDNPTKDTCLVRRYPKEM
jgi:hypothetical protein